jgi:hypothetical protein
MRDVHHWANALVRIGEGVVAHVADHTDDGQPVRRAEFYATANRIASRPKALRRSLAEHDDAPRLVRLHEGAPTSHGHTERVEVSRRDDAIVGIRERPAGDGLSFDLERVAGVLTAEW